MRILVVPASKYGGTAEIGRVIAKTLRSEGVEVDVSQPEHMFDLTPYAAFVIGSGLYMGKWLDQANHLVEEHAEVITTRPTWLFSSGPLGDAEPVEPIHADVVEHLLTVTGAKEHRLFGGRLELDRLSRSEKFIARWVGAKDGDYREWTEIEEWARGIAASVR